MTQFFSKLRYRLFLWYFLSLVFLGVFIIQTIHIIQYKYSMELIVILLLVFALIGFIIISRITRSLTFLSQQMRQISSKNLDKRITAFKGTDEIGELSMSFNSLLDRLDRAFKRERQFIADVAHEMKTPIATLKSSFEVTLQMERTNEEYRRIIRDSIAETDKITNTLKDILDLAWSEVPNEKFRVRFDLSKVVTELAEITQKLAEKKQIRVTAEIKNSVLIEGFRERLARALLNIMENAVKYSPANGRIHVALETEQGRAVISVRDSGQGIPTEELEHIFDRFYRGGKTDKVFGAGLGLAIAKSTIQVHKGTIKVVSKLNEGSTFFVFLPIS